ncbi:MAG: tetratricopeptide repeat protein [Candidatus Gastranaerophilales bacterium]|nr:tetratricopeptide repeat protein [Candidatus Gastranaerophilales bacterium]
MSENSDKAINLYKNGQFKEAIDVFSSILEHEEDNAEIYNNMGLCYAKLGEFEQAEKSYTKSIKLDRSIAQSYINLSDLYYKNGDLSGAIGVLERGSYELTDNYVIAHLLARVYIEDARYDMAICELEKILDAQPENYDAYYDMGRIQFELGNYEDAVANFENVIEYKENNEFLYYYLAQAYEANNEIDRAISNYLKATAINTKFAMPYKKLGVLFLARGDYVDSIEFFEDYIKLDVPDVEKENVKLLIERINKKL